MAETLLDLQFVGGGAGQLALGLRSRLRNARRERQGGEEERGDGAESGACHAATFARAVPIGRRNDAPAPMFDSRSHWPEIASCRTRVKRSLPPCCSPAWWDSPASPTRSTATGSRATASR